MTMLATPVDNCCGTSADVTAGPAQPGADSGLMLHLCLGQALDAMVRQGLPGFLEPEGQGFRGGRLERSRVSRGELRGYRVRALSQQ